MADQILRDSEVAVLRKLEQRPNAWFFRNDLTAGGLPALERLGLIERIGSQEFFESNKLNEWNARRGEHSLSFAHVGNCGDVCHPELLTDGRVRWWLNGRHHDQEILDGDFSEHCVFPYFRITADGLNAIRQHDAKSTFMTDEVSVVVTKTGLEFPENKFTEEDRSSTDWRKIFADEHGEPLHTSTWFDRINGRHGDLIRAVPHETRRGRFRIHINDLSHDLKSKPLRDRKVTSG